MKCVKATKGTINVPSGTIQRLSDKEADKRVDSGLFKYVPKSEWKKSKVIEK